MNQRRILFTLGVTYETDPEKLKKIPSIVEEVINSVSMSRFDRAFFRDYGEFSLNYEIVYYVLSSDYSDYAVVQQNINLGLFERFLEEEIDFAYPTQTIHMNKVNEENESKVNNNG